ncbi:MAG: hypothetical protein V4465_03280 [Patescibacteria group bacterium]
MRNERGFIGTIILVIIALALLKYFLNWSVFDAAASPQGKETVSYTHQVISTVWHYISAPVTFVWYKVLWPLLSMIWSTFQAFISWGQHTASTPCCTSTN